MDLLDLLGDPRRGLAILSGVVSAAAAIFVWLNAGAAVATAATLLFVAAVVTAVPAVRSALRPGLLWLAASLAATAAGIYVGYVA
jgi:hypothetical protein